MLPALLLPNHLDLMTECMPSNAGTPEHCPAGLDAAPACVPRSTAAAAAAAEQQLMTQSVKRPSTKRKLSMQGPAATPRTDAADGTRSKRLRLDSEAAAANKDNQQASPASTSHAKTTAGSSSEQQEVAQEIQQQGEDGEQENEGRDAVASPPGKSKTMLQAVFSPLFSVFRGPAASTTAATAAAAAAATVSLDAPAAQEGAAPAAASAKPAQPEKASDTTASTSTSGGHAHHAHHAHHPPVPEVPEAAESEVEDLAAEEEEEEEEFDPLLFIRSLPPLEQCIPKHRRSLLPSKTRQCKRKTLVLDLDETLVHSTLEPPAAGAAGAASADFSFQVHFNSQNHTIHVRRRPHLAEFMQRVAALFEVVVFTASQKVYAEKLLNVIDPKRSLIKHRVFRDSCVIVDGNYLKDLTILGRDMSTTCIVDNSPQAFGFQPDNGIPIESWYDNEEDTELLKLLPFLQDLADDRVDDVRPHIASRFRLKELIRNLAV